MPETAVRTDPVYRVVAEHTEPGKPADFLPIPQDLDTKLKTYLVFKHKNTKLYRHQVLAWERIARGENVVLSTPTASGKSLVFYMPVIQKMLQDPTRTSLFLFPQKSLSSDQLDKLEAILKAFQWPSEYLGRYDGTVSGKELRSQIIQQSRILVATPDVLHTTILRLSGDDEYRQFFQRLSYVILDECHLYDGVFGTNMAFLMRRLRQVAAWEGAAPQFIAASATIQDPAGHLEKLTGLPFVNIGRELDGSGSSGRTYRLIRPNPDFTMYDTAWECVKEALNGGEKTIIFLDHRQGAERLTEFISERLGEDKDLCACYRAGILAEERKRIEKGLEDGTIRCVVTTSAMELGIDISGLDRCILFGIPAERTSFFQRIGRVGRSRTSGKVDIFFGGTSVDEYYFRHPELLWEQRFNPCRLNLDNERLASDHAACAEYEAQQVEGRQPDENILGAELYRRIGLKPESRSYAYYHRALEQAVPHFEVNLRMIGDPIYKLCIGNLEIGDISLSQLLNEAYEGAIYRQSGKVYRVESVGRRVVKLRYTKEVGTVVKPIGKIAIKRRFYAPDFNRSYKVRREQLSVRSAWFNVTQFVIGYRQERQGKRTQHIYKKDKILTRFMVTQGLEIVCQRLGGFYPPAARALANAIFKAASLVCDIHTGDLTHAVYCRGDEMQIRILDNAEGGLGLAWVIAEHLAEVIEEAARMLTECSSCSTTGSATGCFLCCRMATDSAEDHLLDRFGGIEYARWLLNLIKKGEGEKNEDAHKEAGINARKNTGFQLKAGALVFIASICSVGKVISSEPQPNGDRLYKLKVGYKERSFFGSYLELIRGGVQLWCLSCNTDEIAPGTEVCPTCGLPLAPSREFLQE